MSGCHWQNKKSTDVAVELNGQTLTFTQLDEITSKATSAEDSAAMAEAYIAQWACDILEYAEAKDRATAELEQLVEDYRRSLYVHEYEQKLIARHRPKAWPDTVVKKIYEEQKEQLRLKESIVKGVLLVVPQGTPEIAKAKGWLSKLTDDNIEKLDKYAFHYASGYEYFPNAWHSTNQIMLRLPLEKDILTDQLSKQSQIVVEDSISVYMLQVVDKRMTGDIMPLDYARETIEQILVNDWQKGYIQTERQQLMEEAERFNKLKRYEK